MNELEEQGREVGKIVKEMTEGITEELKTMLPHINLAPEIPDAEIKQAILSVSRQGMEQLFRQYGQQKVLDFIRDFSQGKRW